MEGHYPDADGQPGSYLVEGMNNRARELLDEYMSLADSAMTPEDGLPDSDFQVTGYAGREAILKELARCASPPDLTVSRLEALRSKALREVEADG